MGQNLCPVAAARQLRQAACPAAAGQIYGSIADPDQLLPLQTPGAQCTIFHHWSIISAAVSRKPQQASTEVAATLAGESADAASTSLSVTKHERQQALEVLERHSPGAIRVRLGVMAMLPHCNVPKVAQYADRLRIIQAACSLQACPPDTVC